MSIRPTNLAILTALLAGANPALGACAVRPGPPSGYVERPDHARSGSKEAECLGLRQPGQPLAVVLLGDRGNLSRVVPRQPGLETWLPPGMIVCPGPRAACRACLGHPWPPSRRLRLHVLLCTWRH